MLPPDLPFADGDPVGLLRAFFEDEGRPLWKFHLEGERIITGH
jgi:hypothetical protein